MQAVAPGFVGNTSLVLLSPGRLHSPPPTPFDESASDLSGWVCSKPEGHVSRGHVTGASRDKEFMMISSQSPPRGKQGGGGGTPSSPLPGPAHILGCITSLRLANTRNVTCYTPRARNFLCATRIGRVLGRVAGYYSAFPYVTPPS